MGFSKDLSFLIFAQASRESELPIKHSAEWSVLNRFGIHHSKRYLDLIKLCCFLNKRELTLQLASLIHFFLIRQQIHGVLICSFFISRVTRNLPPPSWAVQLEQTQRFLHQDGSGSSLHSSPEIIYWAEVLQRAASVPILCSLEAVHTGNVSAPTEIFSVINIQYLLSWREDAEHQIHWVFLIEKLTKEKAVIRPNNRREDFQSLWVHLQGMAE